MERMRMASRELVILTLVKAAFQKDAMVDFQTEYFLDFFSRDARFTVTLGVVTVVGVKAVESRDLVDAISVFPCVSGCLSASFSGCLSACLSDCLPICLSVGLSVSLSRQLLLSDLQGNSPVVSVMSRRGLSQKHSLLH